MIEKEKGQVYELHLLMNISLDTVQIAGTGDAWLDLGLLIEATGMCMQANRSEGKSKEEVEKRVYDYLEKVKNDYSDGGEITYPVNFQKPDEPPL